MIIKITRSSKLDNWIIGTIGEYTFEAKHFDKPSEFGINDGRTSKLYIFDSKRKSIVTYDRGWDRKPRTKEAKAMTKELVDYLEALPKRFS